MDAPAGEKAVGETHRGDGRPRLVGRVGSLDAFWPLIEPILVALQPRRLCEVGVDEGIFTRRLLGWGRAHSCAYVGIDPAPDPAVHGIVKAPDQLILGRSLQVLPRLELCEAYFIDGDHNYYTVHGELAVLAQAATDAGPVIFAHDVSWPWARRDMYHAPDTVPPEARHPSIAGLGVTLESDRPIEGGLRSPGRYDIARHAGGERNGVLTAVEDFLRDHAAAGWQRIVVPMAFGLAILYRPAAVSAECRAALERLEAACRTTGRFLESCEANFLTLYLYAEAAKTQAAYWTGEGQPGQGAYQDLSTAHRKLGTAYEELSTAYRDLSAHSDKLLADYHRLLEAYAELERAAKV